MPVERIAPAPPLDIGDPVPWFTAESIGDRPAYVFQNAGGRILLLGLIGSSASPEGAAMLDFAMANREALAAADRGFLALTCDPSDRDRLAGLTGGATRFLLDPDGAISKRFGAIAEDGAPGAYRPFWLVIDPMMRVLGRFGHADGAAALRLLRARHRVSYGPPPVLVVPRIFEPALCRRLIEDYQADGGKPSGFMRDVDGVTRELKDAARKKRSDWMIGDPVLRDGIAARIRRRLVPEIAKAFHYSVTRIERHLVACYDDEQAGGGYFRAHRDNSSHGTAHRRFAVTINLNAEDYEGGDLCFAEYGPATWRAPTGGAIVFSCTMLHEATPVLRGTRYCYLTFLYDDEAARIRAANNARLGPEVGTYKAS